MAAFLPLLALWATVAQAVTLDDVCTTEYVRSKLPSDTVYPGITISQSFIEANPVYNLSTSGSAVYPASTIDYCNVTLAYSHNARDDTVRIRFWLPRPDSFEKRYLSTGGAEYYVNQGVQQLPGGVIYGAVSGSTDGGFGSFDTGVDEVLLLANGTLDQQNVYMFGYQAHHELSTIGKSFTRNFFNMTQDEKLYAYYQSCSEGGREGWSQVQRFGDEWDGAVIGAPAIRYSFQMVFHLWSNLVEKTLNYYPPPCELESIANYTIAACDGLDGRLDGVVSRSDLCKLHFNLTSIINQPYYCAADSDTPVQNATVSAKGVEVLETILGGMKDLQGNQVYLSYQPGTSFYDGQTEYNTTSETWGLDINSFGGEYVTRFLQLQDLDNLPSLDNVTYDTLKEWIRQGWQTYEDSIHTTWPDLTPFKEAGGKVLHYHGEQDGSIPTASSVHYYDSVRKTMYPKLSYNASADALGEWYRLFLIPGASHCMHNDLQPNGPFPQKPLHTLIEWVENGLVPVTLNGTVLGGDLEGEEQQICAWPLRPMWYDNGTTMECVYDQTSLDTWTWDFDAFDMPVY
ncbi:tannase and feruloyl esterase [Aspergillus sclerotiicarbonarius CBS 121057]|uniref:Carboxylic ester hydrolase n=1 Tax=Aspergillus sclerotiicarbonarius (strain CBS 121057 / IBT 28362) TaxID=1448318 RepID=A0A319EHX6_ASPSB|nr:tannase and feruloyl esterase [Aspergillus sclerotiicarbonarius CBS 121057]